VMRSAAPASPQATLHGEARTYLLKAHADALLRKPRPLDFTWLLAKRTAVAATNVGSLTAPSKLVKEASFREQIAAAFARGEFDSTLTSFASEPWVPLPDMRSSDAVKAYAGQRAARAHGVDYYHHGAKPLAPLPRAGDDSLYASDVAPSTPGVKAKQAPLKVTRKPVKDAREDVAALVRQCMGKPIVQRGGYKVEVIQRACVDLVLATGDAPITVAQRKFAEEIVAVAVRRLFGNAAQLQFQSDDDSSTGASPVLPRLKRQRT